MIPAVIYAAKSTPDERNSIPSQLAEIRAAVAREGGRRITGADFADENASAYKGDRGPGLAAAIEAAKAAAREHGGAELWVFDPDRLARGDGRQARHLAGLFHDLLRADVELRAVNGDRDLRDAVYVAIRGERNRADSEAKAGHVRRGLRVVYELGMPGGGPTNDGYEVLHSVDDRGRVTRTFRLDPQRTPVLREVFDMALRGIGDPTIARELNAKGIRRASGKPWRRRDVQDAVTNRWYAGCAVWHRGQPDEEWHPDGKQPALITLESFELVQALRAGRDRASSSERNRGGRPQTRYALGNGLAKCGRCGSPMFARTSSYKRVDDSHARRYICGQAADAIGLCRAPPIDAAVIDAAVVAGLDSLLVDFEGFLTKLHGRQGDERQRLANEVDRAAESLRDAERRSAKVEAQWTEFVSADDARSAQLVLPMVEREREATDRAEKRLQAAQDALAGVPEDIVADPLLDWFLALRDAVRGRIALAGDELAKVNAALRDLFAAFILDAVGDGAVIVPVLHPGVSLAVSQQGGQGPRFGPGVDPFALIDRHADALESGTTSPALWREAQGDDFLPPMMPIHASSSELRSTQE